MQKKTAIIGSGNIGEAVLSGILDAELVDPEKIICTDISVDRLDFIKKRYGVKTGVDNAEAVRISEVIIYAVKPQIFRRVLAETRDSINESQLVVSVVAGVGTREIEGVLKDGTRVVRAMPNMAAFVKGSATAIAPGKNATPEDLKEAVSVFESIGRTVTFGDDGLMDAVTGLSGSGPAYVFTFIEALADAGVKMGLSRNDALVLAAQTVYGSARLLLQTGDHPAVLRDRVASPGGTTIFGLHALEKGGFRSAVMDAVEAATLRSDELGRKP